MKFATIGTNFILDLVMDAAKHCPQFELSAVYSRSLARAREVAARYGAPLAFDDLNALAACEEIEAVYIASPNSLHMEQAVQMLNAGKHVLCEKPAASNSGELGSILRAAEINRRLFLEAIRPAFSPALPALKHALESIGPVRHATLKFCQYSSRYDKFLAGEAVNTFNPAFSNGAMMDLGVYCVHVLLRLFGKPQAIRSYCAKLPTGVDGSGAILAQYRDMTAELLYSKVSASVTPSEIQGEKGCITIEEISTLSGMLLHAGSGAAGVPIPVTMRENDISYELEEFIRLATSGGAAEEHAYSVAAMALMDEARAQCGIRYPADDLTK